MAPPHETMFDDPREQESFLHLRAVARQLTADDLTLDEPPASLWERIAAESGASAAGSSPAPGPTVTAPAGAEVADLAAARARRRPAGTWVFAVAAAVVAFVFVGVWALAGGDDDVVGTADLAALGDRGSGTAQLVDEDGRLVLHVELDDVDPADDGYLEVWLIQSTDPLRLVSLGPVTADGNYELPAGVDPEEFPVVDVSREPIDGDATHSGDSVVRGPLELA